MNYNNQLEKCIRIHADYELIAIRYFYPLLHSELSYDIKIEFRVKINAVLSFRHILYNI